MKKWSDVLKAKPPDLGEKLNIRDKSILYNTPQRLIEHQHSTTPEIDRRIADLEQRSMVFRRLPPGTTCEHIVQAEYMTSTIDGQPTWESAQFEREILQVMRDSMDRRRFVITFATLDGKRRVQTHTLRINGTVIRPTKGDFHGYIPETPYYLQEEDYRAILTRYGTVEDIRFNTLKSHVQRTNGLHFSITLEPGKKVPDVINFEGTQILIVNKDSRKRCTFCHNYGHLAYQCQKRRQQRITSLEARAEIEAMNEDNAGIIDQTPNPLLPAEPQTSNVGTTSSQSHPQHQASNSGASLQTPQPTPTKRSSPENGHANVSSTKRYATNERINALFKEFAGDERMEDQQLNDLYEHYVTRRNEFVMQSRREIVTDQYPSRDPNSLSKAEWESLSSAINSRFRELLISAFPENHFQLNELYLSRKNAEKPP